jgi:hypothetical protein
LTSDQALGKHSSYVLVKFTKNRRFESEAVIVCNIPICVDKCGFTFPNRGRNC